MRERKNRTLVIAALVIALASTTVAYAVLQTTLNISGTITRTGGSWGQTFKNLACTSTGAASVNATTTSGTNLSFTGSLGAVGDTITCTYDLENTGALPAVADISSSYFKGLTRVGSEYKQQGFTYPEIPGYNVPGIQQILIDDGYTKCWLTQNGDMLDEQAASGFYEFNNTNPYSYLRANETKENLGIQCQYYNLSPEASTSFQVVLNVNYKQPAAN